MSDEVTVKVFANGKWHPMPMTSQDAARLIRERDEALDEVAELKEKLRAAEAMEKTDLEATLALYRRLDIRARIGPSENDPDITQVITGSHAYAISDYPNHVPTTGDDLDGYVGFLCILAFNADGKFKHDKSGIWE